MEASKLSISPEHLRFKPMSKGKRSALRRENIKALIRSKPAGTVLGLADFAAATQATEASAYSMLKTLIKRGEIIKIPDDLHNRRYSYVVNEPVTKKQAAKEQPLDTRIKKGCYSLADIEAEAKDFVWSNDTDSLRDFIKHLQGKEG